MSASGFTCIDTIDTKNVLRNQVVKWVWGLAHSLLSKQGELHPERNVEHRRSLAQDGSPIAEHFTSGACRNITMENTPVGVMIQGFEGCGDGVCKDSRVGWLLLSTVG